MASTTSTGRRGAMLAVVAAACLRFRPGRLVKRAAVVLLAAVMTAACGAGLTGPADITPTRSMVTGTWRGATGAVLVLRPDGTFTARALPSDFGGTPGWAPAQGSGTWHLPPARSLGSVVFDFASLPNTEFALGVERLGSSVVMYYNKGDPDQGVTGQYQFAKVGPG